ncbi:MAG: hydantoinase B/oxoprolinase family protein [Burkholderiaceae bacterium]
MQHTARPQAAAEQGPDPITLEVIRQDLVSIPNQIDKNIVRTAFSAFISEYKDYSVGIVDPTGALISQSRGSLAIFVANALGTAVRDGLEIYGADRIRPGDVILSNHAGTLGQHLNNVVMYTPVHVGPEQRLVAFFCVLMHWIDIGGGMVGSCSSTTATEIFQEGLQLRSVRVIEQGRRNEELFRVIRYNTRFPEMLMGDIDAQLGGCEMGRQLVAELAGRYGVDVFDAAVRQMWDHSEATVLSALEQGRPGLYEAESFLDNDGIRMDHIVPVKVKVRVAPERIVVDFSEVSEQLPGPFNAGRNGGAVAAARIAVKYMFTPGQAVNEGDFRPLEVEIPDGKFISATGHCALGSSGNMIPTVVDTVLHALSEAFPERGAAAHHGTYGVHAFHGIDARTGRHFYNLDTICGGWGATAAMDGYGPSRSNAHGDTGNVPIEMQEITCPYRFESYEMRTDSGGPGRRRGGLGVVKTYRILGGCRLNLKIDRTKCRPWGLAGGGEGMPSEIEIRRADGRVEWPLKGDQALEAGDVVIVRTAGGGGYGPPEERDAQQVAQDVRLGYVSRQAARDLYGVALDGDGNVQEAETARLRAPSPTGCGGEPAVRSG